MIKHLELTINFPHEIRGAVGAVKFQSGLICHFIQKLAQSRLSACDGGAEDASPRDAAPSYCGIECSTQTDKQRIGSAGSAQVVVFLGGMWYDGSDKIFLWEMVENEDTEIYS